MVMILSTTPEQVALFNCKWTGPERRVKKHLRALGWQVHKATGPFLPFHLVALHPVEGVKLLWVYAPRGPDPDMSALARFGCDPAWRKEIWRFPAMSRPWVRPVEQQARSAPAGVPAHA